MNDEQDILALLDRHLKSIWEGDLETYRATTGEDVTFYEWYISTQRIDGLAFHLRETAANARAAKDRRAAGERYEVEHEVLSPKVQILDGSFAIATYTLLMRYTTAAGVHHTQHNETRVFHRREGGWQLVHCHKSPMWQAPHSP
jgi:ketosteroid isomerase-like protein